MFTISSLVLVFAASATAYSVTEPSAAQGWTNEGDQVLSWSRVSTDATNFTAVLTNEDRSVLPTNQVLAALIMADTQTSISVGPPSGGWPLGDGFRVNFVKSSEELNTIYAQSPEFEIKEPTTSTVSSVGVSASSVRGSLTVSVTTRPTSSAAVSPSGSAAEGILPGQSGLPSNTDNGASKSTFASTGMVAAVAAMAFLA